MTLDVFAELVGRMRYHQRRYFRLRQQEDLTKSKELERQVDDATAEIVSTRHERQGQLSFE